MEADVLCDSNPGGSDAGVVVAWDVALGLTHAFDGLQGWDLLGEITFKFHCYCHPFSPILIRLLLSKSIFAKLGMLI